MKINGTLLKTENFNPRAGGGYVEYCTEGYLRGHRICVGRFKYKSNTMANKRKMIKFLVDNKFTVEELQSPIYWDLMRVRGWMPNLTTPGMIAEAESRISIFFQAA
jgi:hypothetical protein